MVGVGTRTARAGLAVARFNPARRMAARSGAVVLAWSSKMPRLVLVNPPNHKHDSFELAPPLGLLVLADIASKKGWDPMVLDLSLPQYEQLADNPDSFYERVAERILSHSPQLVALTSMGVNSHVSLLLARRLKQTQADLLTVAGGIHFSSIAPELVADFPWIDTVISGEGEASFGELLSLLNGCRIPASRRADLPRVMERRDDPTPPKHPHYAYRFIRLHDYFNANDRRVINYEGGRGCVFECAFCYSPAHYHAVRDVPPAELVSDWVKLTGRGARHIFMVQDNFTNNPRHALEVCNLLTDARLPLTWNGYATLPQLSPKLITALGRSGCKAIYLGIDAVSPSQQAAFNKRFYRDDDDRLRTTLKQLHAAGVMPTCAFILDMYDFDRVDADYVFRVAATCAALEIPIRINTFTRYASSALGNLNGQGARYSESKVRVMLDCPEVVCRNELATTRPDLFPFHSTEIPEELWNHRLRMVKIAQHLIQRHAPDLEALSRQPDTSLVSGFDQLARDEEGQWNQSLDSRSGFTQPPVRKEDRPSWNEKMT